MAWVPTDGGEVLPLRNFESTEPKILSEVTRCFIRMKLPALIKTILVKGRNCVVAKDRGSSALAVGDWPFR